MWTSQQLKFLGSLIFQFSTFLWALPSGCLPSSPSEDWRDKKTLASCWGGRRKVTIFSSLEHSVLNKSCPQKTVLQDSIVPEFYQSLIYLEKRNTSHLTPTPAPSSHSVPPKPGENGERHLRSSQSRGVDSLNDWDQITGLKNTPPPLTLYHHTTKGCVQKFLLPHTSYLVLIKSDKVY